MAGLKDFKNNDFSVAINKRLNGIEIRFVNKMNDDQLTTIKDADLNGLSVNNCGGHTKTKNQSHLLIILSLFIMKLHNI